ncbi:Bug family tripartite tricarboxylate transporter substrate binding protein [Variovorax saccharolyticus]|uniref:Bug family tripartite tricarboxylate transporter substrate binding protein n=1 Tax=Variovorax saccharolyticus TaxID=3053516 RepID=UPI002578E339|nr:tripartite tricarboxylate transporter substrate binding protein [Variovorax sp. J31P216]MDM0029764.1 tripartite tricarboxylate transporter substrate binding protein [Variovorax sp. J31P216]
MNEAKTPWALIGMAAAALLVGAPAAAQEPFPTKPITMVVPFPPGGVADIAARPIAEAMGRYLKQPVVIENKGGAGGGIGMSQVAKAKPDGYTVLMALSSVVVLPEADIILQRKPMFELSQLKPIARFTADPVVLVVQADSPWKDFGQFRAALRAKPGGYSFGSSGNYGTMHVPVEQMKAATGTSMLHIPYTGAGPALVALLGGQVDAVATGPSTVAGQIQAGKLRALAQWGEGRIPTLPEVPSLKELGVPVTYSQWTGVFVPASTPDAVVARLREAAKFAAADARAVQALQSAGTYVQYLDTPEFETFVAKDAEAMAKVVQRIGKVE